MHTRARVCVEGGARGGAAAHWKVLEDGTMPDLRPHRHRRLGPGTRVGQQRRARCGVLALVPRELDLHLPVAQPHVVERPQAVFRVLQGVELLPGEGGGGDGGCEGGGGDGGDGGGGDGGGDGGRRGWWRGRWRAGLRASNSCRAAVRLLEPEVMDAFRLLEPEVVGRSGRWYAEVAAAAAAAAGQQRRGRFGGARAKSCAVGATVDTSSARRAAPRWRAAEGTAAAARADEGVEGSRGLAMCGWRGRGTMQIKRERAHHKREPGRVLCYPDVGRRPEAFHLALELLLSHLRRSRSECSRRECAAPRACRTCGSRFPKYSR